MKENNMSKEINYNELADKLNESIPETVRELLGEQVRQAYINLLNESDEDDEKDYDVEEVDDTVSEPVEDSENAEESAEEKIPAAEESEEGTEPEGEEDNNTEEPELPAESEDGVEVESEPEGEEGDDMSQDFDKFKVDGEENSYDFRGAEDDELVKVYKRLKDTDGVTVVKDGDKVEIKDSEAGTEYLIDMAPESEEGDTSDVIEDNNINTDDMTNESKIFEIALNEYDSKVGYTDNYQKKDVMTNSGASEPSKYGHDADGGTPKGTQKPWSKEKKSVGPFNGEKGQTVECGGPTVANNAPEMEEHAAGGRMGAMGRMTGVKSHRPNSGNVAQPEGQHNVSVAGEYKGKPQANEDIEKKLNKIVKENKALKAKIGEVIKMLDEAKVVNLNLGSIIKLITENSTTKDEKHEIVNRFVNEAHTVEQSQALYENISNELKKKPQVTVNINEEKQFANVDSQTINESKFYQDESLMDSLGLMHKICK